ncbi:hypothetical protein B4N89_15805 [Embleya scabrispora]|uniref:RloB-like protein n=1 Tax=Embleya scabrispora TaxID=159449 RepID=A0A1T3NZQ3_9ACTN|nr:hypothetical protein B4N89_15805 [Embleya scabrispora]
MARPQRGTDALGRSSRGSGQRRRVVFVFTEGEVTEPSYFDIITEVGVLKNPAAKVELRIANRKKKVDRKPIDLVEMAADFLREKTREAKRAKLKGAAAQPQVWCVFDHDNHPRVPEAMKLAKEAGVHVAFSHPCFEVWRLAHYKAVTGSFEGVCDLVADRLPFQRGSEDAANPKLVLPGQVLGRFAEARDNARRMNDQHGDHVPKFNRDPYTDMHTFVEDVLGIASY